MIIIVSKYFKFSCWLFKILSLLSTSNKIWWNVIFLVNRMLQKLLLCILHLFPLMYPSSTPKTTLMYPSSNLFFFSVICIFFIFFIVWWCRFSLNWDVLFFTIFDLSFNFKFIQLIFFLFSRFSMIILFPICCIKLK